MENAKQASAEDAPINISVQQHEQEQEDADDDDDNYHHHSQQTRSHNMTPNGGGR